jgi:hypothetical protein
LPALEPVDYVWHPDLFIEAATINMNWNMCELRRENIWVGKGIRSSV